MEALGVERSYQCNHDSVILVFSVVSGARKARRRAEGFHPHGKLYPHGKLPSARKALGGGLQQLDTGQVGLSLRDAWGWSVGVPPIATTHPES